MKSNDNPRLWEDHQRDYWTELWGNSKHTFEEKTTQIKKSQSILPDILKYMEYHGPFDKMIRRRSFVREWVRYFFLWNKAIPFGEKHNTQCNIDLGSRDLGGWLHKANVSFNFTTFEENTANEWLIIVSKLMDLVFFIP